MYRNEIWYGFNRSEEISVGSRTSRKYIYIKAPVEEGMDLFALIWLASFREKISWLPFDDAENRCRNQFNKVAKLRIGEYILLKKLSLMAETNYYSLILSTYNVLDELNVLRQSKKRVTWLHPDLLKLSSKAKLHPLCYVFAKSSLYYLLRMRK